MDDEFGKGCVDSLSRVEIKKEEVLGFLRNIKIDKSPGPDGVYPRILREAREEIAGTLTDVFVSSLATRGLENCRCLFRKNSKHNPGKHRPVNLTSAVGELLERILPDRV